MRIEGSFIVAAPRERVFAEITNPALMAGCIPGCEAIEVIDPKTYRARILIEVGPIKARFNLVVEVKEEVPPARVVSLTRGEEGTRASVISSNNELVLVPAEGGGTEVKYVSEVSVTGRLGKFGLGMMKKKAEALGAKFAENFRGKVEAAATS
ncbi:MAG: SRPBCC domain-containing protein [Alphaproteobacteria bacterium]